jgi:hypothetical protein
MVAELRRTVLEAGGVPAVVKRGRVVAGQA